MRSTPLGLGMLSPPTLLFTCPIRGIMPTINRLLIGVNNNDKHYEALVKRQTESDKSHDISRNCTLIQIGSSVAAH